MEQHKGKIIEQAIKKSGFRMKALAKKLGIARNTLYTRLKEANVRGAFIIEVGKAIYHDFSKDFPDLYIKHDNNYDFRSSNYSPKENSGKCVDEFDFTIKDPYYVKLEALNKKYLKLMEEYNKLLKILILLANDNELVGIKQEIIDFIKNSESQEQAEV